MLETAVQFFTQTPAGLPFMILGQSAPIWVPIILLVAFWQMWMKYIRASYIYNQGYKLLEITLPQEVHRSPKAMEFVITSMYQKGEPEHLLLTYWNGKTPPWFSLELVSNGGYIHLYIWTFSKFAQMIESQLYSQYPNIEVSEAEDYAAKISHDPNRYTMFGCQFQKNKPSYYPIKTYVDYGLDQAPKEELRDDPMTSILEYLGSLRKGEQAWFQILIEANKEEGLKFGRIFSTKPDWKDGAKREIERIRESVRDTSAQPSPNMPSLQKPLTQGEQDDINTIGNQLDKFAFDSCIRCFYIAENEAFDSSRISAMISTLRQFSGAEGRNAFSMSWKTDVDKPWADFRNIRLRRNERKALDAYKRRSYFRPPYRYFKQPPFVLTCEELATMFHVPGTEAVTPTIPRVSSRKSEAPSNLPQ